MKRIKGFIALLLGLGILCGGCTTKVVAPPPKPRAARLHRVWIAGHYNAAGIWIPGHWRR